MSASKEQIIDQPTQMNEKKRTSRLRLDDNSSNDEILSS
jgi:hypothetical protein